MRKFVAALGILLAIGGCGEAPTVPDEQFPAPRLSIEPGSSFELIEGPALVMGGVTYDVVPSGPSQPSTASFDPEPDVDQAPCTFPKIEWSR